ncbi:MAG: TetR/AcrR family transcriptional regulator [Acidimicrobiales bacterium]
MALIALAAPRGCPFELAREVGTTTQAVYTRFGSRAGLLVDTLACRAFEILAAGLEDLPVTDDPTADLVEARVGVFRRFVLEHPALYRIAFQRVEPDLHAGPELTTTTRPADPSIGAPPRGLRSRNGLCCIR